MKQHLVVIAQHITSFGLTAVVVASAHRRRAAIIVVVDDQLLSQSSERFVADTPTNEIHLLLILFSAHPPTNLVIVFTQTVPTHFAVLTHTLGCWDASPTERTC